MAKRAGLYLRISMDRSGEQLGIQRQREDGIALIDRHGWHLAEEYVDNDVSATSLKPRKGYQRMLADIRAGVIDAVVVWSIDRLTRRTIELEEFIELADDHGIALASVGGEVDIATSGGRLHVRIMAAVARDEVEKKGDRQRRQRRQTAEAGHQSGGPRAFGYAEGGLELDPFEAPLLEEAYRRFLAGASLTTIGHWLNEQGTTTPRGNPWRYQAVRIVLANPRNAGLRGVKQLLPGRRGRTGQREPRATVIGDAAWPAVVDRETWEATDAILAGRQLGPTNKARGQRHLLTGIAECATCASLLITGRRDGFPILRCPSFRHVSRKANLVDEYVVEVAIARLTAPEARARLARRAVVEGEDGEDTAELRARSTVLQAQIADARSRVGRPFSDGGITLDDFAAFRGGWETELAQIAQRLAFATRTDPTAELAGDVDPVKLWESWPIEVRRRVVERWFRVVVHAGKPGNPGGRRFDPDSVEVLWRP